MTRSDEKPAAATIGSGLFTVLPYLCGNRVAIEQKLKWTKTYAGHGGSEING
jgi:hypothetical protein